MAKNLQSLEVEECKECYIEILNPGGFLAEAEVLTSLASRSSPPEAPPTHPPIQADYCPQSVPELVPQPPSSLSSSSFSQQGEDCAEIMDVEHVTF